MTRQERLEKRLCTRCKEVATVPRRTMCASCLDKNNETTKRYHSRRKQLAVCVDCGKTPLSSKTLCSICLIRHRSRGRNLKQYVINHYGSMCIVCKESRLPCLQLDHINNDGAEHRQAIDGNSRKQIGTKFYQWLKDHNFETSYQLQVLCANCHALKHWIGEVG